MSSREGGSHAEERAEISRRIGANSEGVFPLKDEDMINPGDDLKVPYTNEVDKGFDLNAVDGISEMPGTAAAGLSEGSIDISDYENATEIALTPGRRDELLGEWGEQLKQAIEKGDLVMAARIQRLLNRIGEIQ
jgi:hypothetical protein